MRHDLHRRHLTHSREVQGDEAPTQEGGESVDDSDVLLSLVVHGGEDNLRHSGRGGKMWVGLGDNLGQKVLFTKKSQYHILFVQEDF